MENQKDEIEVLNEDVSEEGYSVPVELNGKDEFYEKINTNQKVFTDAFKKNKKINFIIVAVFMAVIVLLIFLLRNSGAFIPVMAVLVIVYFVVLHMFSKKTKAKLEEDAQNVINQYLVLLDSYVTQDEAFSEVKFNGANKIDDKIFPSLNIIKDINFVGGRDVIKGKLHGYSFEGGDNVVKTREEKENGGTQDYVVFLGKLFVFDIENDIGDSRAVIYLKGKGANGPTSVEDLELKEDVLSSKYAVYASCDLNNVLNDKAKEILESFEINDALIDAFIVIENHRLAIGLSYSDEVMRIPLFEKINVEQIEQYKKDMEKLVSFIGALK